MGQTSLLSMVKLTVLATSLSVIVYVYLYSLTRRKTINVIVPDPCLKPNSSERIVNYEYCSSTPPNHNSKSTPLLTLFTTWPENECQYFNRNEISVRNWANLKPHVQPVYFASNVTESKKLKECGWYVMPYRKSAASGAPKLNQMFLDVMYRYSSQYYAYANGDILFDDSLIQLLQVMSKFDPADTTPLLIIGRRTNVENVTLSETVNRRNLSTVAKRGEQFTEYAQDYFITNPSFPWEYMPGIVIGRPAYDNWLVSYALKKKFRVIDATNSTLALHQTTKAGNQEGHRRPHGQFNDVLLRNIFKKVNYLAGSMTCAQLYTFRQGNNIEVRKRTKLPRTCWK